MNRRSILNISAMTVLGLASVPSSAVFQQGTLKQQLVGAWTLVSYETTAANGTKEQPFGANPKGMLIFDAGGRYASVSGRSDRTTAALDGFGANHGTWSVSEADKTLTRHVESALRPNNEGDFKYSVSLAGDELRLTGLRGANDSVYRRAR